MKKNVIMMAAAISLCWPASSMRLTLESRMPKLAFPGTQWMTADKPGERNIPLYVRRIVVMTGVRFYNLFPVGADECSVARLWFPNDLGPAVNFAVRFAHKHETLVSVAVEYKARFRSLWLDDRGKNGPEHLGVPASVSHLAQGGFAEYSRLRTVNFENGSALQELPAACFRGSGLSELHLPPGVIKLGYRSLAECRNLRFFSAEQGSTLTEIGPEAFRLSGLETLRLPDSVADIGEQAFADCPNLEELKFGANSRLRKLEDGAFKKCTALRLVNIPGRVTDLGEGCFRDCTALYQVKFDRRDETRPFPCRSLWIHSYAFSNTGLRYFQVPYYARQTGNGQFARCRKLDCIEFEPDPYGKGPIWDAAKMRSR